ncbi:MAG TPA: hypothetical protein VFQ48_01140 [Pseudonocardiaceae bacterium]|nr:hypothetical protein [Pseudonocardiaceae bacterium]
MLFPEPAHPGTTRNMERNVLTVKAKRRPPRTHILISCVAGALASMLALHRDRPVREYLYHHSRTRSSACRLEVHNRC